MPPATPIPLPVLDGPASLLDLVPASQALASAAADAAIAEVEAAGRAVSCRAGCGACCRQIVTISLVEAVALADLVAAMPPDRQAAVRRRFADAVHRLEATGLLDAAADRGTRGLVAPAAGGRTGAAVRELAAAYFALGVACPFLEAESCSVHPDRPTVCREYHVTSPAERCARLFEVGVDSVAPTFRAGVALMTAAHHAAGLPEWQVPIVLALEWAEAVGDAVRLKRDGPALARAYEDALRGQAGRLDRGENAYPGPAPDARPEQVTADVVLGIAGRRVSLKLTVTSGPTTPRDMIPLARGLAEVATRIAGEDAAAAGAPVSCRAGCGACCRQLVPLAEPEAFELAALVEGLPEPRRAAVRGRFADARRRLEAAGLWAELADAARLTAEEKRALALRYFDQGVPCPFLEAESCSIHPDRPLACREYLVSSPAEHCGDPRSGKVEPVLLPVASPYQAFAAAWAVGPVGSRVPWVPLVAAPDWAAGRREPPADVPGPDRLRALFQRMTGAAAPPPGVGAPPAAG